LLSILNDELLGQTSGEIVNIDVEKFPNLDLVASATELPFGDREFDAIVFLRVLHHIRQ
jgi:ubiquinone/menaquinone biosynthesis C-methylase UbiE